MSLGVFLGKRLTGVLTLGAGPAQINHLVEGARLQDCATLTRLWLSDELPRNAESRVVGVVTRALKRHTGLKFLVSYADPSHGHLGTIYQAAGWLYIGLSHRSPVYDFGDGIPRHSRTLSSFLGTRSTRYLRAHGINAIRVYQEAKHRYIRFLDPSWRRRLNVPVLPYPKEVQQ